MNIIQENTLFEADSMPFVALPTALRGKVTPYQLSLLWVLQSYYPNIWPSYSKIAEDANMSRNKVIKTVAELVERGLIYEQIRIDDNNQKSNVYRVNIMRLIK